jgi:hypothetical protein
MNISKESLLECIPSTSISYHNDDLDIDYWVVRSEDKSEYIVVYENENEIFLEWNSHPGENFQVELSDFITKCQLEQGEYDIGDSDSEETEDNEGAEDLEVRKQKLEESKRDIVAEDISSSFERKLDLNENNVGDDSIKAYYPNQKLNKVLDKISKMNYADNTFNSKKHEDNLETILEKDGFVKIDKNEVPSSTLYFMSQPNGKQSPPDFRVFSDGEYIDIECKSCQANYKPMWNASYPSDDMVYVYTNKKDNETLVFSGAEVVTPVVKEIYEEYKLLNKKLHQEVNNKLKALSEHDNPYGMQVYARNMFVQSKNLKAHMKEEYKQAVLDKYKKNEM